MMDNVKISYTDSMLPDFPNFKKIQLNDRAELEAYFARYEPYSDFNFISLWCWNIKENIEASIADGNVVIKMPDYVSQNTVLSIIGVNNLDACINKIFDYAKRQKIEQSLKLVPEIVAKKIKDNSKFIIKEDFDNFDYILAVDELVNFSGKKYYDKRNLVNRFKKNWPGYQFKDLDLSNSSVQSEILNLYNVWAKTKNNKQGLGTELKAINRLLRFADSLDVYALGCYVSHTLIGFVTFELVRKNYGLISFEKTDSKYSGLYAALNQEVAKKLKQLGCVYINFEQDLGIPGLKKAKLLWRPTKFLKKYTISLTAYEK